MLSISLVRKVSYFLATAIAPSSKARPTFLRRTRFYRDQSLWTTLPAPAPGGQPIFFLYRHIRNCRVLTPISLQDDGTLSSKFTIRYAFPDNHSLEFGRFYSCNGLFCYPDLDNLHLFVWNPATTEVRKLPDSPHNEAIAIDDDTIEKSNIFVATWADPKSQDYKVLRFFNYIDEDGRSLPNQPTHVELYTLKTNSWRKIVFSEHLARFAEEMPRCCINGVFYTSVRLENPCPHHAIISFDFGAETFSAPLPYPKFCLGESCMLAKYDGQPSLVTSRYKHDIPEIDIGMVILQWVLRNGEWDRVAQYDCCTHEFKPLAFARNDELLLFEAAYTRPRLHYHLMVFDTTTQELKQVPGFASDYPFDLFDFGQTFLKLKSSSGEQEKGVEEEEEQVSYLGEFEFLDYED